jgi:hypothetical protein
LESRVEARQPVDGREMIGIEAMFEAEQEDDGRKPGPVGRQSVHDS